MRNMDIRGATLEINTVIGCSLGCVYCPQDTVVRAYRQLQSPLGSVMSLETFVTCLDKLPPGVRIDFSGMAEPWLNPHCTEMLLYAHRQGFEIAVYTTAAGLSEADIDRLADVPFRVFTVHLPDATGRYTRIPHDDQYLQTIRKLGGTISQAHFTVIGTVHPAVREVINRPVRSISLHDRAGNVGPDRLSDLPDLAFTSTGKIRGRLRCSAVTGYELNHNVLFPNGDVALCCMDYGLRHGLGNLLENSYAALFESPEYARVQSGLIHDSDILCRTCRYAERDTWVHRLVRQVTRYRP